MNKLISLISIFLLVGYNEGPRYAGNYKFEYINNSKYVHKVMTHLLKFEPYIDIAGV